MNWELLSLNVLIFLCISSCQDINAITNHDDVNFITLSPFTYYYDYLITDEPLFEYNNYDTIDYDSMPFFVKQQDVGNGVIQNDDILPLLISPQSLQSDEVEDNTINAIELTPITNENDYMSTESKSSAILLLDPTVTYSSEDYDSYSDTASEINEAEDSLIKDEELTEINGDSTILIPPPMIFYPNCTINEIDPNSSPSSEAFDVKGITEDCAAACKSESSIKCAAYTSGGPGSYCVLHGSIDKGKINKQSGSTYSITDIECETTGKTKLQLCGFNQFLGHDISIDPEVINATVKFMSSMNKDHCETYCKMHTFAEICTSYAFDPTVPYIGHMNCALISRDNATTLNLKKGNFQFYEDPCAVSDYTKKIQKNIFNDNGNTNIVMH